MVMVNKYFYTEYFAEPSINDRKRDETIQQMHTSSMKFISNYLTLGQHDGNVQAVDMNDLVNSCFPHLRPFLQAQRAQRTGCDFDPVMESIDYDALSYHVDVVTAIDWLALFRTSELEEARRGRAIR